MIDMDSKTRLETTLNHCPPDRVCIDIGGTAVTGIAASALSRLHKAILGQPDYRVKIIEPYQLLGEVDKSLREALKIDVVSVMPPRTLFGFKNKDWKEFCLFDGTEVLVPDGFIVSEDNNGDLLIYPQGDTSVRPTGRLPKNGFYFDAICRQEPIDDTMLDPANNLMEFGLLNDEDINYFKNTAREVSQQNMGAMLTIPGTSFGDIALVPAMWMKEIKGIRDIEEWYISTVTRRDYVYKVFERQCELAIKNLEKLAKAVGNNVQAAFITGTDFGTQRGLFISVRAYRDLYKPFHIKINNWIHSHTTWKTFIHSCGSIYEMIPDFIDAGFDILNPVQLSADGMDAYQLKKEYGRDICFWGGGIDTQRTLAFGTPKQVSEEVKRLVNIFNEDGGFVFNTVHNIQATTPTENMVAMFKAIEESN
jgi:hypothetical protein